jgi:hypothetical protein
MGTGIDYQLSYIKLSKNDQKTNNLLPLFLGVSQTR